MTTKPLTYPLRIEVDNRGIANLDHEELTGINAVIAEKRDRERFADMRIDEAVREAIKK